MTTDKVSFFSLKTLRKQLQKFKRRLILSRKQTTEVFDEIYSKNNWGDAESVSGPGSRLDRTDKIRAALPSLLKKYECNSLLDIPCGDFNWMRTLELEIEYIGGDIVSDLIMRNRERYAGAHRKFVKLDLLRDSLPCVDLILTRDCLVHFSNSDIKTALKNIKASGSRYLLSTTFPEQHRNQNIVTGEWRQINLCLEPFHLPVPLEQMNDAYNSQNYYDKHLGLWKISELPDY